MGLQATLGDYQGLFIALCSGITLARSQRSVHEQSLASQRFIFLMHEYRRE